MSKTHLSIGALFALAFAAGCDGSQTTKPPEEIKPLEAEDLAVRAVDWNPSAADMGNIAAVAQLDGTTAVLGDAGATVLSGGLVVSTDALVTDWSGAAVIPAANAEGQWIAGLTASGGVYRLRGGMFFEKVSDLYGLSEDKVLSVAPLGGTVTAFALDGQLAISDGMSVTRYDLPTFTGLAGGNGRAVSASDGKVNVFEAESEDSYSYDLEGVEEATFDATGKLVVRTADTVYIEAEDGSLVLRYKGDKGALRGLAASDVRIWFIEGEELAALEATAAYRTTDAKIPAGATLVGSPTGDVWVKDGGELSRYAAETGDSEDRKVWEEQVQPIYHASCTPCHQPGGSAGIDLSTYGAWVARRDKVRERVVDLKTMPPEGIMFTEEQRQVIATWAGAAP